LGFAEAKSLPVIGSALVSLAPPQIIFLDQPHDWVPTAVNVIQFLLLATLTYYIFRRNYIQKTRERHAEWYHRVVTDFAIEEITKFSENSHVLLTGIAKELARLKAISAPKGAMDLAVQKGIGSFKENLYAVQRSVAGRLLVFDKALEQSLVNRCNDLEDDVSEWFNTETTAAAGEPRQGLMSLLNDWQSASLKLIRDYEFKQWK
jgi:hypothetical protein